MANKTYKIFKISSDKIVKHNFNISDYTIDEAILNGEIVSVADNQLFHKIRDYYRASGSEEVHIEKEIINVVVPQGNKKNKSFEDDFRKLAQDGFTVNKIKYHRFCSGSGQIRRNTITFLREELYNYMFESLSCGLRPEDFGSDYNLAKYNAYFGLNMSGVRFLSEAPRVCVVSDYETIRPHEEIDYIQTVFSDDYSGKRVKTIIDKTITRFYYDKQPPEIDPLPPLNSFDGQGLCDPDYAKKIALDLGYLNADGTGYIPSEFILRAPWIKGLVVSFKWKEYCRRCGVTQLKDIYGDIHAIDDIDILLSKSQFKTWKIYLKLGGWKYHEESMKKYNLLWGIVKPNKRFDDDCISLNYQYINALDLNVNDVDKLCQRTEEHLTKLCSGNIEEVYESLLKHNIDNNHDEQQDKEFVESEDDQNHEKLYQRAIRHNNSFLYDNYIQSAIYRECQIKFNMAKLGKVECLGNYQFIVSDPVAQIQHIICAHGVDGEKPLVKGLIESHSVYSAYWNKRKQDDVNETAKCKRVDQIILMRSPLVDQSEPAKRQLVNTTEMQYWYSTIRSGIILSIHDLTALQMQNCDFDGDICFSTNEKVIINGAIDNPIPLLYPAAASQTTQPVTVENLIATDILGLNSKVGSISNKSACFYAKLANYAPGTKESDELLKRIKILGELVGTEIDRIKTGIPPKTPTSWKRVPYPQEYTSEEKKEIKSKNDLLPDKKPYYLRYNYSKLNQDIITLNKCFNFESKYNYDMKIDDLLKSELAEDDKSSEDDKKLAREKMNTVNHYRFLYPVVDSDCPMNNICHKFEALEKSLKKNDDASNMLLQYVTEQDYDQTILDNIKDAITVYERQQTFITKLSNASSENDKIIAAKARELYQNLNEYTRNKILCSCDGDIQAAFNYSMKVTKSDENLIWNIFDGLIFEIIPFKEVENC